MTQYKRYMVFVWHDCDNVSPFECIHDSFDDLDVATGEMWLAFNTLNCDCACVFDREDGVIRGECSAST